MSRKSFQERRAARQSDALRGGVSPEAWAEMAAVERGESYSPARPAVALKPSLIDPDRPINDEGRRLLSHAVPDDDFGLAIGIMLTLRLWHLAHQGEPLRDEEMGVPELMVCSALGVRRNTPDGKYVARLLASLDQAKLIARHASVAGPRWTIRPWCQVPFGVLSPRARRNARRLARKAERSRTPTLVVASL